MVKSEDSTPRKRIWQYAFVTGMAACIVAGILVFGMSSFTTILTVSGIIIGLFNAFLGSSQNTKDGNWFLATIKHTLDVSNFLRVATVVVWLGTIGLVTYGVLHSYHEAQKVTLAGRVLTAGGDPAPDALVILLTQNKRETTTKTNGTFDFSNMDLSQEPSKQVKIRVEWKNRTTEESVDLATTRELTIRLPAGDPPFRVSYITLEGPAIDLLLRGQIDKRWEERLGGQPFIVPNSVSKTLNYLTKNFSVRKEVTDSDDFSIENGSGLREGEGKRIAAMTVGKPAFVGSEGDSNSGLVSQNVLSSLTDPNEDWSLEIGEAGDWDPVLSLFFWRFANPKDFERDNIRNGFDKYITRLSMPPDFCLLTVGLVSCGGDPITVLEFVPRMLKLRVAVLENVSSEPIRIGKFFVRETKVETLRSREGEESTLKALNAEEQVLFAPETLGSREKLLIPLEMPMTYDKDHNSQLQAFANSPSKNERTRVISKLATMGVVAFPVGEAGQAVEITTDRLVGMLNKPKKDPMLDKDYIFGPSVTIDSVTVDNVNYPFRQYDVSKLVIRAGAQIGSCPYVFTYSAQSSSWESEGHILYGRNSSLREATDEKELKRFDGRVVIKELDPEISFIDFVYIKATALDGTDKLLYPQHKALRFYDRDYLRLKQGEQLEVRFDVPLHFVASNYTLVARGYYVPFNTPKSTRNFNGRSKQK